MRLITYHMAFGVAIQSLFRLMHSLHVLDGMAALHSGYRSLAGQLGTCREYS